MHRYEFAKLLEISYLLCYRAKVLTSMLDKDVAWFDETKNSVGALTAKLTGDANSVQGVKPVFKNYL